MKWENMFPKFLRSNRIRESDIQSEIAQIKADIAKINRIEPSQIEVFESTIGEVKNSEDRTPCVVFTIEPAVLREAGIVRPYSTGKHAVYWKHPDGMYT
jgi:hypothetical protein